jgi:hypothetical protein
MSINSKLCLMLLIVTGLAACSGGSGSNPNARLNSLELEDVTLDQVFQANQTDYTTSVTYMVSKTRITAEAESNSVKSISINGEILKSGETSDWIDLALGENNIEIKVTAQNGVSSRSYNLAIHRLDIDSSITALINGTLEVHDRFGRSLAHYDDFLAIGAADAAGLGVDSGVVYMFVRNNGNWHLDQTLFAPDVINNGFGESIAIQGTTMAIGAPRDDEANTNSGAVYIFHHGDLGWSFKEKLLPESPSGDERIGYDLSIFDDTLAVGAHRDNSVAIEAGAVYVFYREGSGWQQQAKLTASDGAASDFFGASVSLYEDTLAIGAYRDDIGTNDDTGSVYIFNRNGELWSLSEKITASDMDEFSRFGNSVSLQEDLLVVGAYEDGGLANEAGAVYIYHFDGIWDEVVKLTASDSSEGSRFGFEVSLSGDRLAIGAAFDDGIASGTGAVYLFENNESEWVEIEKVTLTNGVAYDYYGYSVLLSGNYLFASTQNDDTGRGTLHVLE